MVTADQVAGVLRDAADLIEETGWCQFVGARNCDGKHVFATHETACEFCVMGAINRVTWTSASRSLQCVSLEQHARDALYASLGGDPALYNDAPGRTMAEVLRVLRTTADRVKANKT